MYSGKLNNIDRELYEKVLRHDRKAMKQLYDRHVGYMTAVCSRYVSADADVSDVLQEAFIKIFAGIGKFVWRGEGSLRAWMTRIVVNESLKFLKKNTRFETVPIESAPGDMADENPDMDNIPMEVIHDMIRRLPDGYRTVFNLYVFEDKGHKEIAEILGIKENSSASQLHRAKAMLASWVREYNSLNR